MDMAETNSERVRNFMSALEENDRELAGSYLIDDFIFSGWTPQPLNKRAFLNVIAGLKEGIPGLIFNLHNLLEPDNTTVTATMQISGYQSDSFILPDLGTPPIPQTASSISMPAENVLYRFNGNKIQTMQVEHVPGGGIEGLLRQLGIALDIPH